MRTASLLAVTLLAFFICTARAQVRSVTFSDAVSEDQTYRKDIGHGLDFVLSPDTMEPGVITGWTIEVAPLSPPPDPECSDFAWVVTPPYHFQNVLYLDTSYSTTAQDAVRASPREFKFVLNCDDFKVERERVNRVLQPLHYPKREVNEARAKLRSSRLGRGSLWIQDYKITPGVRTATGLDLGKIHWIKFKVEIQFPTDQAGKESK